MKIFTCLLTIVVGSISAGAAQLTEDSKSNSLPTTNPQIIAITCPKEITYPIQPIAEWDPGLYGMKRLPFREMAVVGRTLHCSYSVSTQGTGDYSILSRDMPPGYICTGSKPGDKSREFSCKRAVPPIKIKPKSD